MILDKKNMVPSIDWFRGVVKMDNIRTFCDNMAEIDDRLKFENFVYDGRSMLNFKKRYLHLQVPSLTFAFNPVDEFDNNCVSCNLNHNNKYILVSFSGDAIRYLGSDTLKKLFIMFKNVGVHVTRLDLALDFFDKDNDVVPFMQKGLSNFLCPSNDALTVRGLNRIPSNYKCYVNQYLNDNDNKKGKTTFSYSLGHHGSNHGMFRLYDKFYEVKYGRHSERADEMLSGRKYWYRAELELHHSREVPWADDAFNYLIISNFNLYAVYGQCLSDFISFDVVSEIYNYGRNDIRYIDCSDWLEFIEELKQTIHFV